MGFDCLICFVIEKITIPNYDCKYYIEIEHEQSMHRQEFPSENHMIAYMKDPFNNNIDEYFDITVFRKTSKKLYIIAKGKVTIYAKQVLQEENFFFEKSVQLNCPEKKKGKMILKAIIMDAPVQNNIISAENKFLVDFNYNQAKMKLMAILSDPQTTFNFTKNLEKEIDNQNKCNQQSKANNFQQNRKFIEIKEEDFLPEKNDDSFLNDLSFVSLSYDSSNEFFEDDSNFRESITNTAISSEQELEKKKLKVLDNILINPRTKVDIELEKR